MLKSAIAVLVVLASGQAAFSATAVNNDKQPRTLVVTEGSSKSELSLAAGETAEFCPNGCFVTLPNGDLEALSGSETVTITNGVGTVK